MGDLE
jgi:hypothetical protein